MFTRDTRHASRRLSAVIAHRNEQPDDGEVLHAGGTHDIIGPRDDVDNGSRGSGGGGRILTGTVAAGGCVNFVGGIYARSRGLGVASTSSRSSSSSGSSTTSGGRSAFVARQLEGNFDKGVEGTIGGR